MNKLSSNILKICLLKNFIFFRSIYNNKISFPLKYVLSFNTRLIRNVFLFSFISHARSWQTKIINFFGCFWQKNKNFIYINCPYNNVKILDKMFFSKYYYNGLGYKIFLRDNHLFIWIGLTHYTILKIPNYIKIFAKKKRIFVIGSNLLKFNEFLMKIRRIRKIDLYKGKGLSEVKNYKGFIKMKSGKKKQY